MSPATLQSKRRLQDADRRMRYGAIAASVHGAFFLFLLFLAGTERVLPGSLILGGMATAALHLALAYGLTLRSRAAAALLVASALAILVTGVVRRYGLYLDLATLVFGYFYVQAFRATGTWREISARTEGEEAGPGGSSPRKGKRARRDRRR